MITFLGTLLLALSYAPAAGAAPVATECVFDQGSATVTATIGSGTTPTLERSGDAIAFDGTPCGAATVTNTDTIDVGAPDLTTTEALTISIAGGQFAPGKTPEPDGSGEIEIAVTMDAGEPLTIEGSAGDDAIWGGWHAIDLMPSAAGDSEVTRIGDGSLGPVTILGGGGNDQLSLARPPGDLGWYGSIDGGPGDDRIDGSPYLASAYDGGPGFDQLSYSKSSVGMSISTSVGSATVARGTTIDTVAGVEVFHGGELDDTFIGGDVPNTFYGGPGNDQMFGGSGTDALWGEAGNDTFSPEGGADSVDGGAGWDTFAATSGPTVFHLDTRTASGEGADHYIGVEALKGTNVYDDRFIGQPASGLRALDGGAGHDVLDLRSSRARQHITGISQFPSLGGLIAVPGFFIHDVDVVLGSPLGDRFDVLAMTSSSYQEEEYRGLGGNDVLVGGPGKDWLFGGPGRDRLDGGPGLDACLGGPGVDTTAHCEAT